MNREKKKTSKGLSPTAIFYIIIGIVSAVIVVAGYYMRPKRQYTYTVNNTTHPTKNAKEHQYLQIVSASFGSRMSKFMSRPIPAMPTNAPQTEKSAFQSAHELFKQQRFAECNNELKTIPHKTCYTTQAIRELAARCFAGEGMIAYRFKAWQIAADRLGMAVLYGGKEANFLYEPYAASVCALGRTKQCERLLLRARRFNRNNKAILLRLFLLYASDARYKQALGIWQHLKSLTPQLQYMANILTSRIETSDFASYMEFPPTIPGFTTMISGKIDITEKPALEALMSKVREEARRFLELDELPEVQVVLLGNGEVFDFIHASSYACTPSKKGIINLPIKSGTISNPTIQQAFANAYIQAIVSKLSGKRASCWLAAGLGSMFEQQFGWSYPNGGLHNLPPLLGASQIRFPPSNLPPYRQSIYMPQAFAMAKTATEFAGMKKMLECINIAAEKPKADFQDAFSECIGVSDISELIERTAKKFGGRIDAR